MAIPTNFADQPWDRVRARCEWVGDCFVWQGGKTKRGYGLLAVERGNGGRKAYVHRIAYEHTHGPIPEGLTIDHVKARGCVSRACCNAAHLEAVTNRENSLRGDSGPAQNARKTHCPKGHLLVEPNLVLRHGGLRGRRECRVCHLAGCLVRAKRQQARREIARLGGAQ